LARKQTSVSHDTIRICLLIFINV